MGDLHRPPTLLRYGCSVSAVESASRGAASLPHHPHNVDVSQLTAPGTLAQTAMALLPACCEASMKSTSSRVASTWPSLATTTRTRYKQQRRLHTLLAVPSSPLTLGPPQTAHLCRVQQDVRAKVCQRTLHGSWSASVQRHWHGWRRKCLLERWLSFGILTTARSCHQRPPHTHTHTASYNQL